jgi:hypothetical protein
LLPHRFADRLGGLFSDSAACAPARRIGIRFCKLHSWQKPVIHLKAGVQPQKPPANC